MFTYQRLTQPERYQIKVLLTAGNSQSDIALILNRDKSTISRELQRNTGQRGYRPKQAHEKALARQKDKPKVSISDETKQKVSELIEQKWSPEQISGWLAKTQEISLSHEWVYQWILQDKQDGGDLYTHLRCQKKRKKRYGHVEPKSVDKLKTVFRLNNALKLLISECVSVTGKRILSLEVIRKASLYWLPWRNENPALA